jgi:hypothetical protein
MKKIKVISSKRFEDALPMMHEVTEEYWNEILKIDNGDYKDEEDFFEFITTDHQKIIVQKNNIHKTNGKDITYKGDFKDSKDRMLVTKFENGNSFEIRDYNPYFGESHSQNSFKVLIQIL